MSERINLQNTPDSGRTRREPVRFERGADTLEGLLFLPTTGEAPFPAVVVTGAWTTVKEQMPGTYARELAARGFAALAFDFRGWGASGGEPRYVEDPAEKTADIHAAIAYLAGRPDVDAARISGLGICASSGYMAAAAAEGPHLSKLALVAPWLHDRAMAEQIYGGAAAAAGLIQQGREASAREEAMTVTAASRTEEGALMFEAPYYTEPERGLIEAYDNRFNVASWEPWLSYDGQASADTLTVPTLIVCSEDAALPAGAHAYSARTKAPVSERWLEGVNQFDFYDRADVVRESADAVAAHLA
ncbi:MAG: alpha/beta fold hydrolase [Myxococcota bacterium]